MVCVGQENIYVEWSRVEHYIAYRMGTLPHLKILAIVLNDLKSISTLHASIVDRYFNLYSYTLEIEIS